MFINLLKNEISRIWGNYKLWLLICAMLALNLGIIMAFFSMDEITPSTYKETKTEMLRQPDVIIDKYMANIDSAIYERLYYEYISVQEYSNYIQKVMESAEEDSQVSIFQSKFSQNNYAKTGQDYESLSQVSPFFVGSYGLEKAISFLGSDIVVILIIIIAVNILFIQDKKSGMISLTKATRYGSGRLIFSKVIAVFIYVAIFSALVYISNILLSIALYGNISFDAPVQSMLGYAETGLKLTIGDFLLKSYLHKVLVYFLLSVVVILFSILSSNEIMLYMSTAVFCIVEILIYFIGKGARLVPLYHISIPNMLNLPAYYAYYNYNIFNYPISNLIVDTVLLVLFILLCLWGCLFAFSQSSMDYRSMGIYRKKKRNRRIYGLISIEMQKFLFGYRLLIIIVGLVIFQIISYVGNHTSWYTDELYYRNYMKQLEGAITEEKLTFLSDELSYLEEVKEAYEILGNDFNEGKISQEKYDMQLGIYAAELKKENALLRCVNYVDYVQSLDISDAALVYDRGWNYLFGGESYRYDIKNAVLLVITIILGAAFMYAEEYKYKMQVLTDVSAKRKKMKLVRNCILLAYIAVMFLLIYLPELLWAIKEFGLANGNANALSLMKLSDINLNISIKGYLVLVFLIRFITICFISLLIACISKCIKNTNHTIIVAVIIFLVPLLLNLLGIHAFDRFSFNALLSGNMFLQG